MNKQQLEKRVIEVAEKVLQEQNYVSFIDVLLEIGYLDAVHVADWRKGGIPDLEGTIQAKLSKVNHVVKCFQQWAKHRKLKPSETKYRVRTRGPEKELKFSQNGTPSTELAYRTHYFSPTLPKEKQKKLQEKLEEPPEHVVFLILKDSKCDQCHTKLYKGNLLYKEQRKGLCMQCSEFDTLTFLPAGHAKLTRRAREYSKKYAVVVRFSRRRKRYERQGLLVEASALKKAESEVN